MNKLAKMLQDFKDEFSITNKGALCVMLVVTNKAHGLTLPFQPYDFLTANGGQVKSLGKVSVQAILAKYGITRVLAHEGGRTSRGSVGKMRSYLTFLNTLGEQGLLDFEYIESWWVDQVRTYFSSSPFKLRLDSSKSLRSIVSELMSAALQRQKEMSGTMIAGAVMQHLVGAKLKLALPNVEFDTFGASVADSPSGRAGDFLVKDTAIHVTTAPSESLIHKCNANLANNFRPLIITTEHGMGGAMALASAVGIEERIDVLEVEQFIATNLFELSFFDINERPQTIRQLLQIYNEIIEECETDLSLKIELY